MDRPEAEPEPCPRWLTGNSQKKVRASWNRLEAIVFCVLACRSRTRQVDMGGPRQVIGGPSFVVPESEHPASQVPAHRDVDQPAIWRRSTSPAASGQPNNSSGGPVFRHICVGDPWAHSSHLPRLLLPLHWLC